MTATTTATIAATTTTVPAPPTPLPLRRDTFLGVCEAIGSDLGFHPNWLRVGFALAMFYSPLGAILGYLGLGLLVAAIRWFAPDEVIAAKASAPVANDRAALRQAA